MTPVTEEKHQQKLSVPDLARTQIEERVGSRELEYGAVEIMHSKEQREKRWKKNEQSLKGQWDKIHVMAVPGEKREGAQQCF